MLHVLYEVRLETAEERCTRLTPYIPLASMVSWMKKLYYTICGHPLL